MSTISDTAFWILTVLLGLGTFLIRFSFLGLLGGRQLPGWALLHLKYVGVAVFPALIVPMVLWPAAAGGVTDPARLLGAGIALLAGWRISVVAAIVSGMGTFYLLRFLLGG